MTEAEILSIRGDTAALVVSVVSVSFAMISAYIAALWLFLKDAPLTLRILSFVLLSCGLAFMGALTSGLNEILLGTERAWKALGENSVGIPGFGSEAPSYLYGLTMYEAAAATGLIAFVSIYLTLFYLTFFYRWPQKALHV